MGTVAIRRMMVSIVGASLYAGTIMDSCMIVYLEASRVPC
jgi:hypothetical protein